MHALQLIATAGILFLSFSNARLLSSIGGSDAKLPMPFFTITPSPTTSIATQQTTEKLSRLHGLLFSTLNSAEKENISNATIIVTKQEQIASATRQPTSLDIPMCTEYADNTPCPPLYITAPPIKYQFYFRVYVFFSIVLGVAVIFCIVWPQISRRISSRRTEQRDDEFEKVPDY